MSATQFAAALRAEGLTVKERSGWSMNNRNHKGAWGPLNGVMIHHTVSGDGAGIVDLCYSGRSDLPGPLCHAVIHKDGSLTLVGWGRANHAGLGDPDALAAVVAESSTHPEPNQATVDGNARFIGFECVNWGNGNDPWPAKQIDAIARAAAAVCRFYGWSADSTIGHLEWTNQKIDPRGFAMRSMRDRIAERLTHSAGWNPGDTTTPPQEEDVALTPDDINKVADAVVAKLLAGDGLTREVWLTDNVVKNPNPDTAATNEFIAPATGLNNIEVVVRRTEKALAALPPVDLSDADIATLASAVASNPALAEQIAEKVAAKLAERLAE